MYQGKYLAVLHKLMEKWRMKEKDAATMLIFIYYYRRGEGQDFCGFRPSLPDNEIYRIFDAIVKDELNVRQNELYNYSCDANDLLHPIKTKLEPQLRDIF